MYDFVNHERGIEEDNFNSCRAAAELAGVTPEAADNCDAGENDCPGCPFADYYLVGINGENTPDPEYWRDRNEIIKAGNKQQAIEKWKQERAGWLRPDEEPFIKAVILPDDVNPMKVNPRRCVLTSEGAVISKH